MSSPLILKASNFDTNPWAGNANIPPDGNHPDFGPTAAPLRFGFMFGNRLLGGGTYTNTVGLDNFSITINQRFQAVQTIGLPDMNNNGASEEGTLVKDKVDGTAQVWIRDGKTQAIIKKMNFGKVAPLGLTEVPDINANSTPEVAVMYANSTTGTVTVSIRDTSSLAIINSIPFGVGKGLSVTTLSDTDGDNVPEIGVLKINGDRQTLDIRDALNDILIKTIAIP